jgi:hypothetical protein
MKAILAKQRSAPDTPLGLPEQYGFGLIGREADRPNGVAQRAMTWATFSLVLQEIELIHIKALCRGREYLAGSGSERDG